MSKSNEESQRRADYFFLRCMLSPQWDELWALSPQHERLFETLRHGGALELNEQDTEEDDLSNSRPTFAALKHYYLRRLRYPKGFTSVMLRGKVPIEWLSRRSDFLKLSYDILPYLIEPKASLSFNDMQDLLRNAELLRDRMYDWLPPLTDDDKEEMLNELIILLRRKEAGRGRPIADRRVFLFALEKKLTEPKGGWTWRKLATQFCGCGKANHGADCRKKFINGITQLKRVLKDYKIEVEGVPVTPKGRGVLKNN